MIRKDVIRVFVCVLIGGGLAVAAQRVTLVGAQGNNGCAVGRHSTPVGPHSTPVGRHSTPVGDHSHPCPTPPACAIGNPNVGNASKPCPTPPDHKKPPQSTTTSSSTTTSLPPQPPSHPFHKDDCKAGGWQDYVDSDGHPFTNEGQCVAFVVHHTLVSVNGHFDQTTIVHFAGPITSVSHGTLTTTSLPTGTYTIDSLFTPGATDLALTGTATVHFTDGNLSFDLQGVVSNPTALAPGGTSHLDVAWTVRTGTGRYAGASGVIHAAGTATIHSIDTPSFVFDTHDVGTASGEIQLTK